MKRRVVVNSKECLSRDSIGQASVAYYMLYMPIGKRLARSKAKTVSFTVDGIERLIKFRLSTVKRTLTK